MTANYMKRYSALKRFDWSPDQDDERVRDDEHLAPPEADPAR